MNIILWFLFKKFNENNEVIMNIELDINEHDKSFMKIVIKKVPHIEQFGVPISISNKIFVVSVPPNEDTMHSNLTNYGLYYVDENDQIPSQDSIEKCSSYSFSGTQLNFVPDVDQNIIEDPFAYVHQPPEKSLIPKNFYQNISNLT